MSGTGLIKRRGLSFVLVLLIALALSLRPAPIARAATIAVNSTADAAADDGLCTLREAIVAANTDTASGSTAGECAAGSGDDTIDLTGLAGTIDLTGPLPDVTSNVVLNGPGAGSLAIRRVSGGDYRIFTVDAAATVVVSGLIVSNGSVVNAFGGGIYNAGALTLDDVVVSDNATHASVVLGGHGGGIYNAGALTLNDSSVISNSVTVTAPASDSYGGGIYNAGTLTLTHSAVSDNDTYGHHCHGGGIHNEGVLVLSDSTVSGNSASTDSAGDGGGIRNVGSSSRVTITSSTVSGNRSNGGGSGGGIWNSDGAEMVLTNSTVSGNVSPGNGGGINNTHSATLTLNNSTVSDNSAGGSGIRGDGGGIWNDGNSTVNLKNSILAGNTASAAGPDCRNTATVDSADYNLVGDDSDCLFTPQAHDQVNVDPLLGLLRDNGGPTKTHALGIGSPAIDAIPEANCTDPQGIPIMTDQRGVTRPQGLACDIGAYEDIKLSLVTSQVKLVANDDAPQAEFGNAVAISGDIIVVGAPYNNGAGCRSGAVYVFRRGEAGWAQEAKLTAGDPAVGDHFGWSVTASEHTILVGANSDDHAGGGDSGAVYVFEWDGTGWIERDKLTTSDAAGGDRFGWSVAASGDTAVIGAPHKDDEEWDTGAAYVFQRDGTHWAERAKLSAADASEGDWFGYDVAISGDTVVVGAPGGDGRELRTGVAYVFQRGATGWTQQAKLAASDGTRGDVFGDSVGISGDTIAVGAHLNASLGSSLGAVYIFQKSGTSWGQQAKLTPSDGAALDHFGSAVSISGDTLLVGAQADYTGRSGTAYIFERSGANWIERAKLTGFDTRVDDRFGSSVALSGTLSVVGARRKDHGSGAAYVHRPKLSVRAYVDGRSQLIVQGDTAYWHHLTRAAPGRSGGADEPTYMNGSLWYPTWPDIPTPENQDCHCSSSSYVGLPALASQMQIVALDVVQARGDVAFVQQPNRNNGYTLIVEFDDHGLPGADWYQIDLDYATHVAPPLVSITGPVTGSVRTSYPFTATVHPTTTAQPVRYTWQATGRPEAIHTSFLSDTIAFTWGATGTKAITVTAENVGGTVTATHFIAIGVPKVKVIPDFYNATVTWPERLTRTLTIANLGQVELQFRLADIDPGFVPFGYTYKGSNEPDGPAYQWIEIAPPAGGTGTELTALTCVGGTFWPLSLPFVFNFYGTDYTDIAVGSNGTIYFEDAPFGCQNVPIPGGNENGIDTFIAPLWTAIAVEPGAIYYRALDSMFIIEYYRVTYVCDGLWGDGTWQVILFENGSILFQYQDVDFGFCKHGERATVGIQGDTMTGLQYSYDTAALFDGLAICFAYPDQPADCSSDPSDVSWLSEEPMAGTVTAGAVQSVDVVFDTSIPEVVQGGKYYAMLSIFTNDPHEPLLQMPVTMTVAIAPESDIYLPLMMHAYP